MQGSSVSVTTVLCYSAGMSASAAAAMESRAPRPREPGYVRPCSPGRHLRFGLRGKAPGIDFDLSTTHCLIPRPYPLPPPPRTFAIHRSEFIYWRFFSIPSSSYTIDKVSTLTSVAAHMPKGTFRSTLDCCGGGCRCCCCYIKDLR